MRQLTEQQAAFIDADTNHSNANVSLLHIFDQATAPGGVVRFKTILAQIESRLHRSPLFRQRLQQMPLGLDRAYWVDDAHFDVEYHVRHIALPKPGDWRQFCIQASRLHARQLDLGRPLWEAYVIEGLDSFRDLPAGSFALLLKTHQAALDLGHAGELSELLLDTSASPRPASPPEPWLAKPVPGQLALASHGVWQSARSPTRLARPLVRLARQVAPAALSLAGDILRRPPDLPVTRFSAVVSPHRVFETRRFADEDFARIARLVRGASVDDVVLAVCGDALRRYLSQQHELPIGHDLVAHLPGPVEAAQTTWRQVALGTTLDDPLQRLKAIRAQRRPAAQGTTSKGRPPPANCSISLLPAPEQALFLCGARMTYYSAILPIHDGMGLSFAVTRQAGQLVISPTSCRELLPDPELFASCVREAFQALLALTRRRQTQPGKRAVRSAVSSASGTDKPRRKRRAA